MSAKPERSSKLSREAIRKRIGALPSEGGDQFGPVTQKAALAAFFDLESHGSTIPEHIKKHEAAIYDEILSKLEAIPGHPGHYVITAELLRGIIKRIGHTASAQATLEVGGNLLRKKHRQHHELAYLKRLFAGSKTTKNESEPDIADAI